MTTYLPLWAVQAFIAFYNAYQVIVGLFGLRPRRPGPLAPPKTRFAFLVAAHDEEAVIGALIESCLRQRYPRELFEVWVVADNCADKTAEVARAAGARVVERVDPGRRGKNHAIRFGLDHVLRAQPKPDAVVVVDADNLVHPDFLARVNGDFVRGAELVQGYLGTKNPDDSLVSRLYYLSYTLSNRSWQLARENLGLVCALGGTGMCISTTLLERIGWHPETLTEDLEFTVQAWVLAGVRARWDHEAVVYDEKPAGFWASVRQRERWMRGHVAVARRYVLRLLAEAACRLDWRSFDLALYLLSPFRMAFAGLSLALALTGWELAARHEPAPFLLFGYRRWFELFLLQVALPLTYLFVERVPARRLWSFLLAPIWGLTWVPLAVSGILRHNDRTWNHTVHGSQARIEDVLDTRETGGAAGRRP